MSHRDIEALHRRVSVDATYQANRTVALLSRMFNLSVRWGWRADDPAKGIERNQETKRHRYLSADELASLMRALAEHRDRQAANVFRLLLLTGARRGEVLACRWNDLDLTEGVWTKPGLPIIGALLGHTQPGTTSRYAHLQDDPLRAATERVGALIAGKPSAEVLPLKGAL